MSSEKNAARQHPGGGVTEATGRMVPQQKCTTNATPCQNLLAALEYAALAYAKLGWYVFPCRPRGKTPLTPHGCKDATTDPATIRQWWSRWPRANVGIATGRSGLVVVDVDGEVGRASWQALRREYSIPADIPQVRTGKGTHYYFSAPPGLPIRPVVGLRPGVDVRAGASYVIAPPSVHPSGAKYEWADFLSPADAPPPPLPPGLAALLAERTTRGKVEALPDRIPQGQRNAALTSLAGSMRRRGASQAAIEAALLEENRIRCDPPLPEAEVLRIARSVARYSPAGNGHGVPEPPAWLLELPHPADEISVFCPAPSVKLGQNRNAGQETKLRFRTAKEIAETTPANVPWVARPWVVQGAITELDGKIKAAGKTTFLLHLVRAVLDGRPFLGQATAKTHVVFLTEQNDTSFREALEKAGLLGRDDLHVLAWSDAIGIPWHDIMALAVEECHRVGAKLLIVDTLGQWAGLRGDSENNAGDALEAIEPVQRAAASGLAVIVSRHERKSGGEVGDSARGSSAFGGAVDIILSLRRAEGNASDNVRVLHALSRFSETPATLTVELTEDGYVAAVALRKAQEAILDVAPATEEDAMTLEELRKAAGCGRHIAIDAIGALLAEGTLTRVGAGKRGDPYRYYLTPEPGGRDAVPGGEKQETGPQCQKGGGFVSVPTTSLGAGQKTESAGPPTDLPSTCAYCGEVVWTYYGDEGLPLCERHAKAMGAEVT